MNTRQYFVETWDMDEQTFTPQEGIPSGPYSMFGLRRALRQLQECGYVARKPDPLVMVWCEDSDANE